MIAKQTRKELERDDMTLDMGFSGSMKVVSNESDDLVTTLRESTRLKLACESDRLDDKSS